MLGMKVEEFTPPEMDDVGTILPFEIMVENNADNMRIIVEQMSEQLKGHERGETVHFDFDAESYSFTGAHIKKFQSDPNSEMICIEVAVDSCRNEK